jgi:hypothetical protein
LLRRHHCERRLKSLTLLLDARGGFAAWEETFRCKPCHCERSEAIQGKSARPLVCFGRWPRKDGGVRFHPEGPAGAELAMMEEAFCRT